MIYDFRTSAVPSLSQVGGKARALMETTAAGFPVPEGFVLSADYFEPWIKKIMDSENWTAFTNTPEKAICELLMKQAAQFEFTDHQNETLREALAGYPMASVFAVRSSSPEEDLEEASFAGQYESILGVPFGRLENAVAEVFSSMLDYRVMEYRKLNNLPLDIPRIALIVQRQIPSDVSGIAFSLNPNNNCYDEAVINASFGLGETIVSGQVSPDSYVVDKARGEILDKKISAKKIGLWLKKDGGTRQQSNPDPLAPALSDDQIMKVAGLAAACENHYGKPMDIEWAIFNDKLYLLQARPVTTHFPLYPEYQTRPGDTKHLYADLVKMSQGFESSLSVLGAELFSCMITNAKMGLMPQGKDGAFYTVNGRIYMDFSNIAKALSPGYIKKFVGNYDSPTREVMKDFDFKQGYTLARKPGKLKSMTLDGIKMIFRVIPAIKRASKDPKGEREYYFNQAEKGFQIIDDLVESDKTFCQCVDAFMEQFRCIMSHAMGVTAAVLNGDKIKKMFKGMDLDDEIIALTIDLPGNPTSEMGRSLVTLASFPEIQDMESPLDFVRTITNRSLSKEFLSAYDKHMMKYGCRCAGEIDIAAVRPYEDLEGFFKQLKLINVDRNAMQDSKMKKETAYAKLLDAARAKGKEKQFVRSVEIFNILGIREHPKYLFVYANNRLRQMALKLAEGFVSEGRLNEVEDIFMVDSASISKAQTDKNVDLKPMVVKNKKARELTKNVKSWPTIIDSRGKIFRVKRKSESGDLVGDPVSPGVIRGRAKVLGTPFEKPILPGDILVAKATEPIWTPVFINASAVVMEVGGPLQHGAIIAREYGIPCVTGIDEATQLIRDDDLLEVDGSSGLVKIVNE